MSSGARINRKYLDPNMRKSNFKKCVACGKSLHPSNKSGLCSGDQLVERNLNYRSQGFFDKWKKERLKLKNDIS